MVLTGKRSSSIETHNAISGMKGVILDSLSPAPRDKATSADTTAIGRVWASSLAIGMIPLAIVPSMKKERLKGDEVAQVGS